MIIFIAMALLSTLGIFFIFFFLATILNLQISSILLPFGIVASLFNIYLLSGLNGAVFKSYRQNERISFVQFYSNFLATVSASFKLSLLRLIICILIIAPAALIYYFALIENQYALYALILYSLIVVYSIFLLLAPSFIFASFGSRRIIPTLKQNFNFLKVKHIRYAALYALYAICFILNFIPLLQLVSIFFLYPLLCTALMEMISATNPESELK